MTYLALRADAVPDYYGMKLDREESWQRIEQMLERIAARVLGPEPAGAGAGGAGAPPRGSVRTSAPGPASPPPRRRP